MKTAILITLLLVAGCAGEQQPSKLAKTEEIGRAAIGFSQCMRDKGHQIPDPTFNDEGLPVLSEPDRDRSEQTYENDRRQCLTPLNDAMRAAGVPNPKGTPEQWLGFARCMREHGVEMADPPADGGFRLDASVYDSPAWQPAAEACGELLPPAMRAILTPPGPKGGPGK